MTAFLTEDGARGRDCGGVRNLPRRERAGLGSPLRSPAGPTAHRSPAARARGRPLALKHFARKILPSPRPAPRLPQARPPPLARSGRGSHLNGGDLSWVFLGLQGGGRLAASQWIFGGWLRPGRRAAGEADGRVRRATLRRGRAGPDALGLAGAGGQYTSSHDNDVKLCYNMKPGSWSDLPYPPIPLAYVIRCQHGRELCTGCHRLAPPLERHALAATPSRPECEATPRCYLGLHPNWRTQPACSAALGHVERDQHRARAPQKWPRPRWWVYVRG